MAARLVITQTGVATLNPPSCHGGPIIAHLGAPRMLPSSRFCAAPYRRGRGLICTGDKIHASALTVALLRSPHMLLSTADAETCATASLTDAYDPI